MIISRDEIEKNKNTNNKILVISDQGKYEYTLLGKNYIFTANKISDNEMKIEVSDYGLTQIREDNSISLLNKENIFILKKGKKIILRTQTTDYGEQLIIYWN